MLRAIVILTIALFVTTACGSMTVERETPTQQPMITAVATTTLAPTNDSTPMSTATQIQATLIPTAGPTELPTSTPTPTPICSYVLTIKKINLNLELVSVSVDENSEPIVPDHEAGIWNGGFMPGEGSNVVIWGHVLRFLNSPLEPAPFERLDELKSGDEIILTKCDEKFIYEVYDSVNATPDQFEYLLPTLEETVTLITCAGKINRTVDGVHMTHRHIVLAKPK